MTFEALAMSRLLFHGPHLLPLPHPCVPFRSPFLGPIVKNAAGEGEGKLHGVIIESGKQVV